jgi:hypothetical protein
LIIRYLIFIQSIGDSGQLLDAMKQEVAVLEHLLVEMVSLIDTLRFDDTGHFVDLTIDSARGDEFAQLPKIIFTIYLSMKATLTPNA